MNGGVGLELESRAIDPARRPLEVVERKGVGHPDSLCDAAAEAFSRRLSRAYLEATGRVLHHNVDKALLVGGRTEVAFGGGRWIDPITLTLAGRATSRVGDVRIAVDEVGLEAAAEALSAVRALDPADPRQVEVRIAARPGATELREVFDASARGAPRSNDTSIGVGFAPFSPTERLALAVEARLRREDASAPGSPLGEDTKVMVIRQRGAVQVTVAVAMRAGRVPDEAAYRRAVEQVREWTASEARAHGFDEVRVFVNAADQPGGPVYLTLSGTSAECGDDGQVGRGNRASGLITPMRPMTLEAQAGKNPCTHVGKLLSLAARRAAQDLARLDGVRAAECVLVSRIGAPVAEPQGAGISLDAPPARVAELRDEAARIVAARCAEMPGLWREIVGPDPVERAGATT